MSRKKKEVVEEVIDEPIEEGTPAIFLRKVDVIIQNENEEPVIIKVDSNPEES